MFLSTPGRRRAPRRPDNVVRSAAVLAASGALVAAFAVPADAVPPARSVERSVVAPAAAPALIAPAAGPVRVRYGVVGVKAVAKPKPKPKPKPRPAPVVRTAAPVAAAVATRTTTVAASRSTARRAAPAAPAKPAPPSVPAHGGVLAIAASLSGIPYVYGGSTPAGFDCSGFTSYVFARVGISLPRSAAAQQASSARVSNPQPGDLVFFGYPAYHVGIYAGGGMMYDSPRTGKSSGLRAIWSSSATYGRP